MSGRKNVLLGANIFVNADMSGNLTSTPVEIQFLDNVSITLMFPTNSAATGSFVVEVCPTKTGTYVALPFSSTIAVPDVDNQIQIECTQLAVSWIRVRYVFVSGTGTLNGVIQAKEI